jgi:hypothetical protein
MARLFFKLCPERVSIYHICQIGTIAESHLIDEYMRAENHFLHI